jgi:glycosyltransferase involved in cell wall biosynthesis
MHIAGCERNNRMNVLFLARHDLFSNAGGDTIQLKSTAKYLAKSGVNIDIRLSNDQIDYSQYDLLHLFNIINPEDLIGHVWKANKPYVVSTIYVNYREYDRYHRKGALGLLSRFLPYDTIEYLKTIGKVLLTGEKVSSGRFFLKGHRRSVISLIKGASYLLPNSDSEYKRLVADYGVERPYGIIPNAIDREVFENNREAAHDKNHVLCVARVEGRKNQLNLIRALKGTGVKLVLIGRASTNQNQYVQECMREADGTVTFIPVLTQAELLYYYRQAKVHVLPSWFETTGLSSLEAAAMGCNVVVTDKGDVKEYFGNMAYYCDPADPADIARAIKRALEDPVNPRLSEYVLKNYIWEVAAEKTLKIYQQVLNPEKISAEQSNTCA